MQAGARSGPKPYTGEIVRGILAAWLAALLSTGAARAESGWSVQLGLGMPLNLPVPLSIRQSGQPDLRFAARYETRPFEMPVYWGAQVAHRSGDTDWALEILHQKLYLANPPPEVQDFSISHGYNLVTLSRGWRVGTGLWARLGAGTVLAHPESTVRGRALPEGGAILGWGYRLSGVAVVAAVEQRVQIVDELFLALHGAVTGAYGAVPVADGSARVATLSLHARVALGVGPAD